MNDYICEGQIRVVADSDSIRLYAPRHSNKVVFIPRPLNSTEFDLINSKISDMIHEARLKTTPIKVWFNLFRWVLNEIRN